MGLWVLDADTLARSRFVISQLTEAFACLVTLDSGLAAHPGEQHWLAAHRPAYQELLDADPVTRLLVRTALRPHWIADFLVPAPPPDGAEFHDELAVIRATAPSEARYDLAMGVGGRLPAALYRNDLPERAADLLEWVWTRTVLPYWPRRKRLFEADILARTRLLTTGGWAAALEGIRPGMRWLGEGRLQINHYVNPPLEVSGAQLLFVPASGRTGWVSWDKPHRFSAAYPCVGQLAEPDRRADPGALGRLLGTGRAGVLVLLDAPKSTTQLVALSGQGLGSVGRHLKVLLDAGLVLRRRAGRSVLYYRTTAGDMLVAAQA
ncbi:helix-turn-helix domain-containing protein [Streptomyces sp. NBC_01387]|uniref:helix-turn-helix domain-containing protein n=1 Tax=unclassified Streptomyces TaxID=2593676 RepID=UPI0020241B62|nr:MULTISPECIES: helix-turn-helix domain-containing protein [unclassified Streptomyces]MCX4547821.1 helix-turn-helix domain-containing protein [Streptomyces sp. NBC_01500]WSV53524.1 helix-turn-helix domain-containing protein [Streptomyces sp. NBC_01014]